MTALLNPTETSATQTEVATTETTQNSLNLFWDEFIDVWYYGFMGVDIGTMIMALGILAIFLILRGILSRYILGALEKWVEQSKTELDNKIIKAITPPVRFIPIIAGIFFASQTLPLEGAPAIFFNNVVRSLIVYTIFWALHRALDPIQLLSKRLEKLLSKTMTKWIFKCLKIIVIFVGGAVILEIWGIAIGPLLAGLGLFGAAVALGAQDLFKNLIAGATVIAEKRFHPGDWIKVEGIVEGVVEEIGFRSTLVRRFDKAPVFVPNAALSDATVINYSRMTHRRIYWQIGVTYGTSHEQLTTIRDEITKYIEEHEDFEKPEIVPTFVRIEGFKASSIDFMIYCFTKTTVWGEWLEIREAFALAIKDIVENKAGTSFAFPSRSLYIETLPEAADKPEAFIPPQEDKEAKKAEEPEKTEKTKKESKEK
ncbi:MAG: mechanosensitive ion channel family protein [Alphaproteobacteria bacterium]